MSRIRDIVFGFILLVVCFILYRESKNIFARAGLIATPALWPQIIITLLAVLSIALILISFRAYLKEIKQNKENGKNAKINFGALLATVNVKVVASLVLTLIFVLVFRPLGFVITIPIYFILITMILEPTKNLKTIALRATQSIVLVLFIYFVFVRGLRVLLPFGPLPSYWFF